MSNKHTHHSNQRVFHQQADTFIVQQLPTSGIVHIARRTTTSHTAGKTCSSPRDVEGSFDTSRRFVRLPANPTERRTESASSQSLLSKSGREHPLPLGEGDSPIYSTKTSTVISGTHSRRPDTGGYVNTARGPHDREAPEDPGSTHRSQELVERPAAGVRQDKARLENARRASRQPALETHVSRAQLTNNKVVRSQSVAGKQKLVQVTLWVDPDVKAHLERRAREEGLSLSPSGAAFLRKAVQQDIDLQYSALLRPIIETAIAKQMAGIATRLTWLLVRIAFDAGQTRSLVTNILGRQQGVTQPLLKTILDSSGRSAKANIMRRTPQISDLIYSVEQCMLEENRGEGDQKTHD